MRGIAEENGGWISPKYIIYQYEIMKKVTKSNNSIVHIIVWGTQDNLVNNLLLNSIKTGETKRVKERIFFL